ncbi:MAG: hypothetical protein ACOCVJ_03550 [Verrucomicrobiota bacterium]
MNVLILTVFLSLLLAGLFLLCFIHDRRNPDRGSSEQDALRPFDSENSVKAFRK